VSRLRDALDAAARGPRKLLVTYLCVGDPSVDESIELAVACAEAGADVLELGVPFSDPSADGAAIARASERAIRAGGGLSATLRVAKAVRARTAAPIVLFGYYNPLYVRGERRSIDDAVDAGVDALLVVDLPLEAGRDLRDRAAERGVAVVPLLAPTSTEARARSVAALGERAGFVYYVSVTGVTGSSAVSADDASRRAAELRAATGLPVVVGFGIDGPDRARAAAAGADGVVVGTALVRAIEQGATAAERKASVTALVRSLRASLDEACVLR
jgi:tryptophan synthase alpha chain